MKNFLFLAVAILCETLGTTMLKQSEQFTKPLPSIITIVAYLLAFYLLSLSLKAIPVGIAYGIWAGVGIVLVTIIGSIVFKQTPDLAAILGITLIISGVLVINFFSKMNVH